MAETTLVTSERIRRQAAIASTLELIAQFIRTNIRAADYFTGYTTLEAVNERLAQIGVSETSQTEQYNGKLTRFAALNAFEAAVKEAVKETKALGGVAVQKYEEGVAGTILDEFPNPGVG